MAGQKNLQVYKTKWFDVIFAQKNEAVAKLIIEKADSIYEEAAQDLGIQPQCRMPVVITTSVEQFNANWSCIPYNHIVIYDTAADDELLVFNETVLNVFKHEITHSLTYNMKNKFWTGLDKVFGDPMYLGALSITKGTAEGAAVAIESKNGEGRLNNEYSKQSVKQAKLENKFPSYWEVQGASEKYPVGKYYSFNGAFHWWLQQTYGMEKYARFWYELVNFKSISAEIAFKKVYKIKIGKAWKEFEKNYQVPEVVQTEETKSYFEEVLKNENNAAVVSDLHGNSEKLFFTDEKNDGVYFYDFAFDAKKAKKLFTLTGIKKINISKSGNYLTAIYNSSLGANVKSKLKIYDIKTKSFKEFSQTNIHDAVVAEKNGELFLICKKYDSPKFKFEIFKINLRNSKIASFRKITELCFETNVIPENLIALENGNFAFVKRNGLLCSICEFDEAGNLIYEASAPKQKMDIRQISEAKGKIYFSWVEPGSMPKAGCFDFEKQSFELYSCELSGGIYWPLKTEKGFFYIGNFYQQNKLLLLKDKAFDLKEEFKAVLSNAGNDSEAQNVGALHGVGIAENTTEAAAYGDTPSQKLGKPAFLPSYYAKGVILPFSLCSSVSYNKYYASNYWMPFGISYISENPWSAGRIVLSAGYGLSTDSFGFMANYSGGTETNLFKYSIMAFTEADGSGWKQARGVLNGTSVLPFGNISRFILSENGIVHYGRSNLNAADFNEKVRQRGKSEDFINKYKGSARPKNTNKYFFASDSLSFSYSNIVQRGDGKYSFGGFSAGVILSDCYNSEDLLNPYGTDYKNKVDAGFNAKLQLPKLIPLKDNLNLTYNLPAKIGVFANCTDGGANGGSGSGYGTGIVQKASGFPDFDGGYVDFKTVLFGADIQKGNGILFFNDLRFEFNYKAGFSYFDEDDVNWRIKYLGKYLQDLGGKVPLEQYFGLRFVTGITPNWGITANYLYETDFYCEFGAGVVNGKNYQQLSFGLSLNL